MEAPDSHRSPTSPEPALVVTLARTPDEVRAAQRLRWQVFVDELGAHVDSPDHGLDTDRYDPHCDHLLVRQVATGDVVGTYRMLPPERVARAGGFYAESEFHLTRLLPLHRRMVEVGRACVRADHRTGAVISLLWSGLLRYLVEGGHEFVVGCASIGLRNDIRPAAALCRRLRRLEARLTFGPLIQPGARSRRELAAISQAFVALALEGRSGSAPTCPVPLRRAA
jgi:putative hemolysin